MIMAAFDLLLALGLTLRLTRLVINDHLGEWFVIWPAYRWADKHSKARIEDHDGKFLYFDSWQGKIHAGLICPYCVGFWLGVAVLISLYLCGGPGDAAMLWRYTAGAFALNYVAGHLSAKVD